MDHLASQAAARGDTLAVDAEYFHALFTRAHSTPPYDPFDPSMVRICANEYDFLTRTFAEYLTLRKTLLDNGVKPGTLEILIKPHSHPPSITAEPLSGLGAGICTTEPLGQPISGSYDHIGSTLYAFASQPATSEMALGPTEQPSIRSDGFRAPKTRAGLTAAPGISAAPRNPEAPAFRMPKLFEPEHDPFETGAGNDHDLEYTIEHNARSKPGEISLNEQRTVDITDFSPATSIQEIVEHVKGGMLVEIYRCNDRAVRLSFLHGANAQAFCTYARRNDIYINNKRVVVDWADRHWRLSPYVKSKILNGATRILRLHGALHHLTEQNVRLDMEHIDHLAILDVKTQGNDIVVYTNSVNHCVSARNCMMTRKPYKFLKIEFERDHCDGPLPQPIRPNFFDSVRPSSQHAVKPKASVNLYDVLDLDPAEDEEDDSGLWQADRRDSALIDYSSDICELRWSDSDPMRYT